MLNFDDEIATPQHSSDVPAGVNTSNRVRAADKRVINGTTDVNQLVPFKHKWAWEKNIWRSVPTTGCRKK